MAGLHQIRETFSLKAITPLLSSVLTKRVCQSFWHPGDTLLCPYHSVYTPYETTVWPRHNEATSISSLQCCFHNHVTIMAIAFMRPVWCELLKILNDQVALVHTGPMLWIPSLMLYPVHHKNKPPHPCFGCFVHYQNQDRSKMLHFFYYTSEILNLNPAKPTNILIVQPVWGNHPM